MHTHEKAKKTFLLLPWLAVIQPSNAGVLLVSWWSALVPVVTHRRRRYLFRSRRQLSLIPNWYAWPCTFVGCQTWKSSVQDTIYMDSTEIRLRHHEVKSTLKYRRSSETKQQKQNLLGEIQEIKVNNISCSTWEEVCICVYVQISPSRTLASSSYLSSSPSPWQPSCSPHPRWLTCYQGRSLQHWRPGDFPDVLPRERRQWSLPAVLQMHVEDCRCVPIPLPAWWQ